VRTARSRLANIGALCATGCLRSSTRLLGYDPGRRRKQSLVMSPGHTEFSGLSMSQSVSEQPYILCSWIYIVRTDVRCSETDCSLYPLNSVWPGLHHGDVWRRRPDHSPAGRVELRRQPVAQAPKCLPNETCVRTMPESARRKSAFWRTEPLVDEYEKVSIFPRRLTNPLRKTRIAEKLSRSWAIDHCARINRARPQPRSYL